MEIKFKIIEMHPDQHSMVVRYWTDLFSQDDLATSISYDADGNKIIDRREDGIPARCQTDVNINIWQVPAPSSNVIIQIANNSAPYDWFALKHAVADPTIDTGLANVALVMNTEYVAERPVIQVPAAEQQQTQTTETLTEDEITALINSLISNTSVGNSSVSNSSVV